MLLQLPALINIHNLPLTAVYCNHAVHRRRYILLKFLHKEKNYSYRKVITNPIKNWNRRGWYHLIKKTDEFYLIVRKSGSVRPRTACHSWITTSTLSKLISTLKVLIDFANHFRSAEYALITNLIWAKPINDQPPQCI